MAISDTDTAPPLVSVIVITYNGARFIEAQLRSIASQSYSNFEIVLSDDGSSDNTVDLVSGLQLGRPVKIIFNPGPRGINHNVSFALQNCSGELIAIADQDDIWRPEKIASLVDNLNMASAIFSDSELVDECGNSLGLTLVAGKLKRTPPSLIRDLMYLLYRNSVSGHALLLRRELLQTALPLSEKLMYDQQIALAAIMQGGIRFLAEPLVLHRQHAENSTNRFTSGRRSGLAEGGEKMRRYMYLSDAIEYVTTVGARMRASSDRQPDPRLVELGALKGCLESRSRLAFFVRMYWLLRLQKKLFHMYSLRRRIRISWQMAMQH